MAEKILQTRIINKHAELGTWELSTLPLKEGEIALAKVMVAQPDGTQAPTYVAKIGLEGKTFAESPMLFAPASDVHLWAKATSKPAYNATEIKLTTGSTVQEEITALKTAVGDTEAVQGMITAAIEALDTADTAVANQFVTAVAQEDGTISVTRRALEATDIPALGLDKITGLQDALNAKANANDVKQTTDAISARLAEGGDVYASIVAAKKAGTDAQSYAEGVNTAFGTYKTNNDARVKAIEDDYTTATQAGTIAQGKVDTLANGQVKTNKENIEALDSALDNLAGDGRTTETVKANADAIAKLAQDIGNVANVMNFRGVSLSETVGADISNPQNGDVIIHGEAEYVYNGSAWIKFGDASDNATAISELQGRVTNVENDLKAGGTTYQSIVAAKSQADKGVADAASAQAKADANETAIGVINGTGDGSIAKALSEAKAYADTAESDAVTTAKDYTDEEIDKVEKSIGELTTVVGTNKTDAASATKAVADDLADYKTTNNAAVAAAAAKGQQGIDDAAAALKYATDLATTGQVNTNKQDIVTLKSDVDSIEANFAKVKTANGVSTLVVGTNEDVIIFDCGGAE